MDDRQGAYRDRLPEASEAFTQAILRGGDGIRRWERRQRLAPRLALLAAAVVLLALGLGVALARLNAPKPDNTVLSLGPGALPSDAKSAGATPAPTESPEAGEKWRIDPVSGWEYLLDDGPFEAGEWLVLTEADGCMAYGLNVPFSKRPEADARSARAVVGMMVRYLGPAEGGFARVAFSGQEGYVPGENLRRGVSLPSLEGGSFELDEAALYITDREGDCRAAFVISSDAYDEAVTAYALKKILESLEPVDPAAYESEPFGAVLVARMLNADDPSLENGVAKLTSLRLNLPRTGTLVLLAEDGQMYRVPPEEERLFWSIFRDILAETWTDESD